MSADKEFALRASDTLKKLERALTDIDDGLEADLAGDVLTIEFTNGRPFIVNSHSAARQVWLSADARAWHFSFDDATGRWIDTREGRELWSHLQELLSKRLGRQLSIAAS